MKRNTIPNADFLLSGRDEEIARMFSGVRTGASWLPFHTSHYSLAGVGIDQVRRTRRYKVRTICVTVMKLFGYTALRKVLRGDEDIVRGGSKWAKIT